MSKERLEEIESKLISWKTEELESTIVDFWPKDIRDVEWLIEQAGRVQELEVWYHSYHKEAKLNNMLKIQNKRFREVIEDIKETADDYRAGHLLDIQDSFFVDEIIAIINNLEGDLDERN